MNSGEVINFAPVALVVGDSIQLSFNFAYRTVPASGWLQCGLFNSMGATLSSSGAAPDGTTTHIGYFVQKNPAASTTDCAIYSTLPGGAGAGGITNATTPTKLGATFSTGVGADALISHSVNFTLALGSGNLLTTTFTLDGTSYVRTDSAPITTTFNEFMWDPSSWGGNASLVDNIVVSSYVSPEPSTWGLLAIGLGATFLIRARRTRICVRNQ